MKYYISLIAVLFSYSASAQFILTGHVTEDSSAVPLQNTSVFIPELHRGVLTDEQGNFRFTNVQKGRFLLQVSLLGHETVFKEIEINADAYLQISMHASNIEMQEVRILGINTDAPLETSRRISVIDQKSMKESGALSISDAVAKLPGMSQLTTGPGISKPVIRGLYGNRIQVNTLGVRFDNQQWQDEHGLGLSEIGVDRVEIIQGPAALLYGSEAIGGVINIIEEKPAPVDSTQQELNTALFSNTYGAGIDYGIKRSSEKNWWKLRAGLQSHADYSDGKNDRVLNSRFADYLIKASTGSNKKNWINVNNACASFSQFGFVFDTTDRKILDSRLSRTMDGPHHQVFFGMLTTENTFYRERSKIQLNAGIQSNLRQEQEGGNRISLNMLLNTFTLISQLTHSVFSDGDLTYGISGLLQTNKNFGSRTIIPDALTNEASVFVYYRQPVKKLVFENGLRYDLRQIITYETSIINNAASEIQPFNKILPALNGSVGMSYIATQKLNVKMNLSTGYRSGNLAELSSNGLHEGTLRWEIGDPDLTAEQNLNAELGIYFTSEQFTFTATAYANRFFNYIYLAPTGDEYFGFDIYRYKQTNALLQGFETGFEYAPHFAGPFSASVNYSFIDAQQDNGLALPFIPANRLQAGLYCKPDKNDNGFLQKIFISADHVFAQQKPAEFETPTDAYTLFDAGFSGIMHAHSTLLRYTLSCNNVFNVLYFDHLSRFKNYGIYNTGRNISFSLNIPF